MVLMKDEISAELVRFVRTRKKRKKESCYENRSRNLGEDWLIVGLIAGRRGVTYQFDQSAFHSCNL